jgi:L-ascorbate metabolism protein UlaG (beta-lactamase superfamily)
MRIRWYGQSAFLIGDRVFVDPFGDMSEVAASRGLTMEYPAIEGVTAEVLLVTHEHGDHNAVEKIGGAALTVRSTAGTFDSVVAIASEHDDVAGTRRGPNTIFRFELDGTTFCHFGDFGQAALRPEQREAIGDVDVLFLPVGDGPTVGGERAATIVRELGPRLVVPMHYRTEALSFLDPPDAFLTALGARVERLGDSEFEVEPLLGTRDEPVVALPAPPLV